MPVTVVWAEGGFLSTEALALDIYEEETYNWATTVSTHPTETGDLVTDNVQIGNPKLTVTGYVTNKPGPSNYIYYGAIVEGSELFTKVADPEGSYGMMQLQDLKPLKEYLFQKRELDVPGKKLRPSAAALVSAAFEALVGNTPTADERVVGILKPRVQTAQVWTLADPNKNRIAEILNKLVYLRDNRIRVDVKSDLVSMTGCVVSDITVPRKVEDGEGASFSISFEQIKTVTASITSKPAASALLQAPKAAGSKATTFSETYPEASAENTLRSFLATGGIKAGILAGG